MYESVLDDPKVQKLSDPVFRGWVNLLCLASRNEGEIPGDLSAIAFALRTTEAKAGELLKKLEGCGLIEQAKEGVFQPHNWAGRQYQSDNPNARVKKYRDKVRASGEKVGGYLKYKTEVLQRDGNACIYCGATENLVMDHIVPVARGGVGEPWNLASACRPCNAGKSGRDPFEAGLAFCRVEGRDLCHAAVQRVTRVSRQLSQSDTVTVTPPEQSRLRADSEQSRADRKTVTGVPREAPSAAAHEAAQLLCEELGITIKADPERETWGGQIERWIAKGGVLQDLLAAAKRSKARGDHPGKLGLYLTMSQDERKKRETDEGSTGDMKSPTKSFWITNDEIRKHRIEWLDCYVFDGRWAKNESANGTWADAYNVGPPPHDPRTLITDELLDRVKDARAMRDKLKQPRKAAS